MITTEPFAGWVTDSIDIGPASTSVSLPNTNTEVAAASSSTVAVSSTATGTSSTHVTVIDTVATEPPLSVYVNVSAAADVLQ